MPDFNLILIFFFMPLFSRTDLFKMKGRDMDTGISWLENVLGIPIKAF